MDYLPLPQHPTPVNVTQVPLFANVEYDGEDFRSYPARNGWTINGIHGLLTIKHNGLETSVPEAGGMLQTWLFFGLIFGVTGEMCDMQTFTYIDASGNKNLNTMVLRTLVSQWSERLISEDWSIYKNNLERWRGTVYEHILLARETTLRVKGTPKYADLDLVCMANAALGELLIQALKDIFLGRGLKSPVGQSWRVLHFSDCGQPLLAAMLDKGWCPYKIAGLNAGTAMSIGKLWYFAHMTPPDADLDHKGLCTSSSCNFMEVRKSTYEIKHETAGCSCTLIGPKPGDLAVALESGSIPIITIETSGAREEITAPVHAEPYSYGMEYLAISHVWADGHGNPDANESPSCFLNSLLRLSQFLPLKASANSTKIWLDTLCVPREPRPLKNLALSRLREPYENASYILVVDSYLRGLFSASMSTVEIVARIEASAWSQRLWTFEEGHLSEERLWFQFADRSVNLYDLIQNDWRETFFRIPSLPSHSVDLDILGGYNSSALWETAELSRLRKRIPYVRHSLSTRTTSHMEDEAICLVNIMDLPIEPILGFPDSLKGEALATERMKKFWSLLPSVPVGMALSMATKKLSTPGYRWAPASLMGDIQARRWGGPQGLFEDITAKPSEHGLLVNLFARPIFALDNSFVRGEEACQQSKDELFRLFREHTSSMESFLLRDEDGNWYECALGKDWHQDPARIKSTEEASVLLGRPGGVNYLAPPMSHIYGSLWHEEGVLITHDSHFGGDDPILAKAHRHVWLSKVGKAEGSLWDRLWSLMKTISVKVQLDQGSIIDSNISVETLSQHIKDFVKEDPDLLNLGKRVNEFHNFDASDEAVLQGFAQSIRHFSRLAPWCATISTPIQRVWCIS